MRAAAIQLCATGDLERNLGRADQLTRAAVADGAQLVVLPEKWNALGDAGLLRAAAQDLDGPAIAWARAIAAEHSIDLIAGSIVQRIPGTERLANTLVHVGSDGEIRATYRKIHMFDVEVDGRVYRESEIEDPGEAIVTSTTREGVSLGLSICYDLRFPELYRILALRGAQVLTLPAAFTLPTTRDHWEVLIRARAIENQAFVVAANQIGEHPGNHRSGGRSMIVDPWGVVLAQAPDREGHICADLDLASLRRIRTSLPALANRRPSAYHWPAQAGDAIAQGEVPTAAPEPLGAGG